MPFGPATASKSVLGFDPRTVANCQLWLDAADLDTITRTAGTNNITAWRDKSVANRSFTATNNPVFTANFVNGNSAIYLNSANTPSFNSTSFSNTRNVVSVFCVAILSTVVTDPRTSYGRIFSATSSGNTTDTTAGNIFIGRYAVTNQVYATTSTGANLPNTITDFPTVIANSPFMYSFHAYGTYAISYLFGTTVLSTQLSGSTNYSYTQLHIGRSPASTTAAFWDGYLCEILVYNTVLTDQQRQQVEGYLAWKWGLMGRLPTAHPFALQKVYARSFLPTDINGCVAWFDAADRSTVNTTGTTVNRWKDKSGFANDATPGTGPTYTTDGAGRPCLSFNGTSQTLVSSARVPTHTHCLIAVWAPTTVTGTSTGNTSLFRFQVSSYIVFPYMQSSTARGYISIHDGATTNAGTSVLVENSVAGQINACIANISPTNQQVFRNGALQSSGAGVMTTFALSDTLTIGSFGTTTEFFQGNLFEMIIYNTQLNTSQRQFIEAYLAWKWNLRSSLVSTNPYLGFPPTSSIPFLPTNIPNCVLWLDGADTSPTSMTFSSGRVLSSWRDKSGNARNATGVGSPLYVPSSMNGVGSILLNNSPYFTGTLGLSGEVLTCFAVATNFDLGSGGSNSRLVSLAAAGQADWNSIRNVTAIYASTSTSSIASYRNNAIMSSNLVPPSRPFIAAVQYNGSVGSMFLNGSNATFGNISSVESFSTTNYAIGNQVDLNGQLWNGFVGEVIIYSSLLSDIEREFVEGYLAKKWSINISDGGVFSREAPPNFPGLNIADMSGAALNLDLAVYTNTEADTVPYIGNRWNAFPNTSSATRPTRTTTPGGSSAVLYNGTDQYLFDTYGFINTGAFTIEVTFLADPIYAITNSPLQSANVVVEYNPAAGYVYTVVQVRDGFIRIGPWNFASTGLILAKTVPNRWYHIVLTNSDNTSSSRLLGYVNGVLVNTAIYTRSAPTRSYYGLARPGNPNSAFFKGQTGYIRIYTSVLNETQIRQNYNTICERYGLGLITTTFPLPVYSLDSRINYYRNFWDTTQMFNYTATGYNDLSGGTVSFNGTNQYGDAPDGYALWSTGFSMFVIVNFEPTAGSFERIFDFGNGAAANNILFCRSGTTTSWHFEIFRTGTSIGAVTGAIQSGLACYCITISSDGLAIRSYINNGAPTLTTKTSNSLPLDVYRSINYIGRSNWAADAYFSGRIGIIQLYNVELTAAQISVLYNQYKSRFRLP